MGRQPLAALVRPDHPRRTVDQLLSDTLSDDGVETRRSAPYVPMVAAAVGSTRRDRGSERLIERPSPVFPLPHLSLLDANAGVAGSPGVTPDPERPRSATPGAS